MASNIGNIYPHYDGYERNSLSAEEDTNREERTRERLVQTINWRISTQFQSKIEQWILEASDRHLLEMICVATGVRSLDISQFTISSHWEERITSVICAANLFLPSSWSSLPYEELKRTLEASFNPISVSSGWDCP